MYWVAKKKTESIINQQGPQQNLKPHEAAISFESVCLEEMVRNMIWSLVSQAQKEPIGFFIYPTSGGLSENRFKKKT